MRNFGQRLLATFSFLRYSLGLHGPAIAINDGEVPPAYPKDKPHRAGVIVLDTASAAVLRTRSRFTRSVGPGLVFTSPGEYLAGAVDLHIQISPKPALGPESTDENPFAPWDEENETSDAYEARQQRRFQTSGETRDGVEVVPIIYTKCRLDPDVEPGIEDSYSGSGWLAPYMQSDSFSKFGFNPESVRRAITGEAVDPMVVKPWMVRWRSARTGGDPLRSGKTAESPGGPSA